MQRKNTEITIPQDVLEKLAGEIAGQISSGGSPGLSGILETVVNAIMKSERATYLSHTPGDDGNGFYKRLLPLSIGKLNLKVPRVRIGNSFRPAILPARWKRVGKDYEELLIALLANNYSQAQIKRACEQLDLPFSQEALNDALELIEERLSVFKTQLFNDDWFAIFIDAYHARQRAEDGRVIEISVFTAVGINIDGEKKILGFWVCKGKENRGFWTEVFQELISRGVSKTLMFVTDNFPGITDVIKKLYPYSDHQLCYVHLCRNIARGLSRKASAQGMQILKLIKTSRDQTEGGMYYDQLCELIETEKSEMAAFYRKCREQHLNFLKYPAACRKYIYTTNAVESVNSGIERMRINLGGYFPSQRAMDVNLFIQFVNLQDCWEKKTVAGIRECLYEIRQLFALRFEIKDN
jgi:transposase-like protein